MWRIRSCLLIRCKGLASIMMVNSLSTEFDRPVDSAEYVEQAVFGDIMLGNHAFKSVRELVPVLKYVIEKCPHLGPYYFSMKVKSAKALSGGKAQVHIFAKQSVGMYGVLVGSGDARIVLRAAVERYNDVLSSLQVSPVCLLRRRRCAASHVIV